jgi:hypothetical protein
MQPRDLVYLIAHGIPWLYEAPTCWNGLRTPKKILSNTEYMMQPIEDAEVDEARPGLAGRTWMRTLGC